MEECEMKSQVVAANPGWWAVMWCEGKTPAEKQPYVPEPVIAWLITIHEAQDSDPEPYTYPMVGWGMFQHGQWQGGGVPATADGLLIFPPWDPPTWSGVCAHHEKHHKHDIVKPDEWDLNRNKWGKQTQGPEMIPDITNVNVLNKKT